MAQRAGVFRPMGVLLLTLVAIGVRVPAAGADVPPTTAAADVAERPRSERHRPPGSPAGAGQDSTHLRTHALTITAAELRLAPTSQLPHVWGVVMELGLPTKAVASLVTFAEGSTSLYFSNGGAIIGSGQHPPVRAASQAMLAAAETHLRHFAPASGTPKPAPGRVRFYIRTFEGMRTADVSDADLLARRHPLSEVYHAGRMVIETVRIASQGGYGGGAPR